jgi:hypothetical protein
MDKFKKIDKEFCITDNSVNVYKYRCLTEGLQLDEVKKNPIGFRMHKREDGVVVRWADFRIENDKLYAKPVINLSHPDGEKIADEVENGFLNAASVGRIVCLSASDDPKLKLKGQTGPTVTKWFPREISLVDIPGNYNALASLYDEQDNELNLSDVAQLFNPKKTNKNMNPLTQAEILTALNLSDQSTEAQTLKAINDLVAKANQSDQLAQDLADKTQSFDALKLSIDTQKVQDLVDKGIADKKVSNALAETLKKDYATNPEGLAALIDNLVPQVLVTDGVGKQAVKDLADVEGKSWDQLYAEDKLEEVRTKMPDLYEKLRNQKYPKK